MTGQPKRPWEAFHHSSSHDFPGSHGRRQQVHSGLSTDIDFSVSAYEATLVYGQEAFAKKLRLTEDQGGHLIRWTGADCGTPEMGQAVGQGESEVWIDRYDILHLLPTLPPKDLKVGASSPFSSTGWSELPSDAEDTFFFSGDEGDDYERGKKRRRLEAGRAERLQAMNLRLEQEAADEDRLQASDKGKEVVWGGHDEEPPSAIKTLMMHTAKSLLSSPNPQVLELRILTHHAGDPRFSFLKGRYKNTWEAIKRGEKPDLDAGKSKGGLGGLMGEYGDSDSDDSDAEKGNLELPTPPPLPPSAPLPDEEDLASGQNLDPEAVLPDQAARSGVENGLEDGDKDARARMLRREKALAWIAARRQTGQQSASRDSV
ncbi:hypothetical protein NliqN6_2591 [Naganishia liquefaciens]|uniref:SURP motif domain-containing protein n=1 Tax=Naganishia liquefaciens TaxID=104408 RepID=A0A8H3TSG3_9TREE|nr:hypothetical protein NliqN6_2591 [Naganishia liquefaciens]